MGFSELSYILQNLDTTGLKGSDTAPGNLFLLKERYKIKLEIKDNCLIREYNYSESIKGYAFPIPLTKRASFSLRDFFQIISDGQKKKDIYLCLFTEEQKNQFNDYLANNFPEYKIEWHKNLADCDYIYLQSDLEKLPGKNFKKRKIIFQNSTEALQIHHLHFLIKQIFHKNYTMIFC